MQLPITSSEEREINRINWLYQLFAELEKARKIVVSPDRRLFMTEELNNMGYTFEQAKRARLWIIHGDWRMRGADPTLELSDFFPDDDQYQTTVQRMNAARMPSKTDTGRPRTNAEFADYMQRYLENDGLMS